MGTSSVNEIKAKVRTYILEDLLLDAGGSLADEASLMNAGVLDSTAAMQLVLFLDETFGCTIGDDEITVENLDSVNAIAGLIQRKAGLQ